MDAAMIMEVYAKLTEEREPKDTSNPDRSTSPDQPAEAEQKRPEPFFFNGKPV